ncbi:3-dehydroquinate dehydratase (modular protein) [Flavobacterium psychrophilum]|nr:3-dehydroquinate dehydratase (modular protein) [Flavobacterium psychrophilum]
MFVFYLGCTKIKINLLKRYCYTQFKQENKQKLFISMKIIIVNGPNLNLLGKREPEIYGSKNFEDYFEALKTKFPMAELSYYQSNVEGEIINKLQEVGFTYHGIILNAGAYTHTSIAIADCLKAITTPVVEVHISNTFSRETFRHQSYISPNAKGVIIGFGLKSYDLAVGSYL